MRGEAKPIIWGLLNGSILTAVLWWMINASWQVGGVGILQQQPWPLSSIYVCAAMGALLGLGLGILVNSVRREHRVRFSKLPDDLLRVVPLALSLLHRESPSTHPGL